MRQGKLIESEVETRRALLDFLRLFGSEGPSTAGNVLILADILQAEGRYRDTQKLAEIALEIYVHGGVEPVVYADALQRIAVGQASQGRWNEAMATFEKLKAAVANDEPARKRYTDGNFDLAVALVRSGQGAGAIPIFESLIKKRVAEGGNNEYAIAEVRGFLGAALSSVGRYEEAFRILHAAVPILIDVSDATAKEEGAIDEANRRQIIVDSYFNLLVQIHGGELEASRHRCYGRCLVWPMLRTQVRAKRNCRFARAVQAAKLRLGLIGRPKMPTNALPRPLIYSRPHWRTGRSADPKIIPRYARTSSN